MAWLILLPLSYLLGAVPTALIFSQLFAGVDIRTQGSGNVGATNAMRVLGWKLGTVVLVLDMAKGLLPVLAAQAVDAPPAALGFIGLLAVIGHCYPVYLEFDGGKGVATAGGVLLGLLPQVALAGLVTWGLVIGLSRKSSLGSLSALLVVQLATLWLAPSWLPLTLALAALLVLRHRENIQRLMAGRERRVG